MNTSFQVSGIKTHRHRVIQNENGLIKIQRDYLIKWSGVDQNGELWDDTWEPLENIKNDIPEMWREYESKLHKRIRKQQWKFVKKRFPVLQMMKKYEKKERKKSVKQQPIEINSTVETKTDTSLESWNDVWAP